MNTEIVRIGTGDDESAIFDRAGRIIQENDVVAFPTETVYGLGANALDSKAVERIFEAKGRPADNPLIVHIDDLVRLKELVKEVSSFAQKLMDAFWPGPLTLIFKKTNCVPLITTGGLDTVAIRMPNHPIAQKLIRISGCAIAAPSANTSGRPSPTCAEHVFQDLAGRIPLILDGGATQIGLESTVLDVSGDTPRLLRPGSVTQESIEQIIGSIECHGSLLNKTEKVQIALAPGMKYRHYAPNTPLVLFEGSRDFIYQSILDRIINEKKVGKRVVVLKWHPKHDYSLANEVLFLGNDDTSFAQNLFSLLRRADDLEADIILGEGIPAFGLGVAIMNRYRKAAIEIQTI